jgi:hypothetical protein
MNIILLTVLLGLSMSLAQMDKVDEPVIEEPIVVENIDIDEDMFKRELQNAVLEFVDDLGMDPDSVYIPYRDEL